MSHPTDGIEKDIEILLNNALTEDEVEGFLMVLYILRSMGDRGVRDEFVRLLQKWVAST